MSFCITAPLPGPSQNIIQSKKRKWDDDETATTCIDRRPFTVRNVESTRLVESRTFTPFALLSRANLPIAWLDTATPGSLLFTANIISLQACQEYGDIGKVLLAEEQGSDRLYAVEQVGTMTYALCRLCSFVNRSMLDGKEWQAPVFPSRPIKHYVVEHPGNTDPWWHQAVVKPPNKDMPLSQDEAQIKKPPVKSNTQPLSNTNSENLKGVSQIGLLPDDGSGLIIGHAQDISAQESCQELVEHYLDALYLSRTSLAYLVKGPVSRARAIFSGSQGSDKHPSILADFLRDMLLSSSSMERKYKEGLQNIVVEFAEQPAVIDEQSIKKRISRKRKVKRDRNGFFSNETIHIGKWWRADELDTLNLLPSETISASIKRRTAALRIREIYLQVILILEIQSLEKSRTVTDTVTEKKSTKETQRSDLDTQADTQVTIKKSKKPTDLRALLESLLERVTIWSSLENNAPAKGISPEGGKSGTNESIDAPRNFCIEVIIPFYMARLPQVAAMVNKKLGGPSPPTPAPTKHASASRRPGEPTSRHPSAKSKADRTSPRPTSAGPARSARGPPGLHRSATDSQLHNKRRIKRESSDSLLLHSIPTAKAQPREVHSNALANLTRREIDLDAVSAATEEKLRRRAEQEEKVREAIAGLKKPNRSLALQENAERVDARFAEALVKRTVNSQAQRKTRINAANGIHVAATPKISRTIAATPRKNLVTSRLNLDRAYEDSSINPHPYAHHLAPSDRPSSTPAVPQTGHRPRHVAGIEETPSRRTAWSPPHDSPTAAVGLGDSPIMARTKAVECTPSKARIRFPLAETPVNEFKSSIFTVPNITRKPEATASTKIAELVESLDDGNRSIYHSLGWDEDEYEELA